MPAILNKLIRLYFKTFHVYIHMPAILSKLFRRYFKIFHDYLHMPAILSKFSQRLNEGFRFSQNNLKNSEKLQKVISNQLIY